MKLVVGFSVIVATHILIINIYNNVRMTFDLKLSGDIFFFLNIHSINNNKSINNK